MPLSLNGTTGIVAGNLANTGVTPASYTNASVTVNAQGQITAASNGTPNTFLRTRVLTSGTTYTKPSGVVELYVFVYGATGGHSTITNPGGIGGGGYAESYFSSPAASYSYTIGAAGSTSGTAGGTTTFGAISITGSGGVTTSTGSSGGVASGGQYNSNGGAGGNGSSGDTCGGGGGSATRAGNGGNGGNAVGSTSGGGGGGTGGNNASGITAGTNATAKAAGALTLPFGQLTETFSSGSTGGTWTGTGANGGNGAAATDTFDCANPGLERLFPASSISGGGRGNFNAAGSAGRSGVIYLVEVVQQ